MKHFVSTIALFFLGVFCTQSQVVTWEPYFATDNDSITIIFNANQGNAGLNNTPPPIYAHTGVITNLSTGLSNWRHVKSAWGVADPAVLMTPLGNNLYRIKFHVRNYYNVPAAETIQYLAFVFRNTTGTMVGRDVGGADIFIPITPTGTYQVAIPFQGSGPNLVNAGTNLPIQGVANQNSTLQIFINDTLVQTANNATTINYNYLRTSPGLVTVKLVGTAGSQSSVDSSVYLYRSPVVIAPVPAGIQNGINYTSDTSVTLCLYAPFKEFVYVIGDFNNWLPSNSAQMKLSPDSTRWWVEINGLTPGQEYAYQYWIDGNLKVGDPFCDKVLDPGNDNFITANTYPNLKPYPTGKTTGFVSILQTDQVPYTWGVTNFQRPDQKNLVMYELLVRDFVNDRTYNTLKDSISYLKKLGVNSISLMPIMEFEGNDSWGYNPIYFLAPDKAYGPKNKLKEFIDSCHANGIAVVLDMVLNHAFGQSPLAQMWFDGANGRPAVNSPYFNPIAKHDFNVGYDFNHESPATIELVDRVVKYWLEEYKFDGYRFDLSKGFTQRNTLGNVGAWGNYDSSRVALWKRVADTMWATSPSSYVILEHFADNAEERDLGNYGMMVWGNLNFAYHEATKGALAGSNINWISHLNRGWNLPGVLGYMESHDEERLMYKNITEGQVFNDYNTRDTLVALERMALAANAFFPIPGPKMMWQFGELGYDISINLGGRTGAKPIRWNYLNNPNRLRVWKVYKALIDLKLSEPAFLSNNFTVNGAGQFKTIIIRDNDMDVISIGNFGMLIGQATVNFQKLGTWYEFYSGDSIEVTSANQAITLQRGDFRLYTTKRLVKPDTSPLLSVEDVKTGVEGIHIFPNPASSLVNILLETENPAQANVTVYDINGKQVAQIFNGKLLASELITWHLISGNGQKLPAGMYTIRVQMSNTLKVEKLVVY